MTEYKNSGRKPCFLVKVSCHIATEEFFAQVIPVGLPRPLMTDGAVFIHGCAACWDQLGNLFRSRMPLHRSLNSNVADRSRPVLIAVSLYRLAWSSGA